MRWLVNPCRMMVRKKVRTWSQLAGILKWTKLWLLAMVLCRIAVRMVPCRIAVGMVLCRIAVVMVLRKIAVRMVLCRTAVRMMLWRWRMKTCGLGGGGTRRRHL